MLVIAGPGSGKTFVLTNRISYLIKSLGVPPEHILVITFTKEAARSMQQRFLAAQKEMLPVTFGTFHAIFYQIIKRSTGKVGNLLTDSEKKHLIVPILCELHKILQQMQQRQPIKSVGNKEELQEDASKCLAAISFYKNTFQEEKADRMLPEDYQGHFNELLTQYEKAREKSGRLDFDDMLYSCLKLFQTNKQILHRWQEQFQYLLIDEFQDINPIQYEIIRLLAGQRQNLFIVGDDDQSIYGFRGSEPSLMKQFLSDHPDCRQVLLNVNYRSRPEIVKASLCVIEENKDRFSKKLLANKSSPQSNAPVAIKNFIEREDQYQYLTARLKEESNPEHCAVLFRTNAQMQGFAMRLSKEKIPYVMKEKNTCLYDHFIAKDLIGYIQFALGDHRRSLFLTFMNKPSRWISREALQYETVDFEAIRAFYRQYAPQNRLLQHLAEINRLEEGLCQLGRRSPFLGMQYIRKGMGYEHYLIQRAGTDKNKLSEWMEVLDFLTMDAAHYSTYQDWFEAQQMVREEIGKNALAKEEKKGIQLMTVHASKGLEFDKVYIPDVNEGIYPHGHMLDAATLEEERRILYVAMTRAKEALELSFITGTKERPRLPSRFLNSLEHGEWKNI